MLLQNVPNGLLMSYRSYGDESVHGNKFEAYGPMGDGRGALEAQAASL